MIPINVVVTIVSISGDESAVRVVYVGVCVGAVDGVEIAPPPTPADESFFSNLLDASPGAELPPRQGRQHRNSVEQKIIAQFHDYSMTFLKRRNFLNDLWQFTSLLVCRVGDVGVRKNYRINFILHTIFIFFPPPRRQ